MEMKLSGIYLVIDPSSEDAILERLSQALSGGVSIVQIWNHWPKGFSSRQKRTTIDQIKEVAFSYKVPVLMHEDWQLAQECGLSGVHFDEVPKNWEQVKSNLHNKVIGLTVGNDLQKIKWADQQQISYLSFCAMFPSPSVTSCEIVSPAVVLQTRTITDLPLFLSGGIRPDNLDQLKNLDFQGIAVISGIMSADNPTEAAKTYCAKLKTLKPSI